jgi:hypothetical protein
MSTSDFLGGLVGYLDSVNKAGLGAEARHRYAWRRQQRHRRGQGRGWHRVPGPLSVFADNVNITSGASGQTVQFTLNSGVVANGFHFLGASPRALGDVNGDHMADLVGFAHDGVLEAFPNGFHLV